MFKNGDFSTQAQKNEKKMRILWNFKPPPVFCFLMALLLADLNRIGMQQQDSAGGSLARGPQTEVPPNRPKEYDLKPGQVR